MTDEKAIRIAEKTLRYLIDLMVTENLDKDEAITYSLLTINYVKMIAKKHDEYLAGCSTGSEILDGLFDRAIKDAFN